MTSRSASIRGWAGIPGQRFERGAIHVVLQTGENRWMFNAVTVPRNDVPAATGRPEWDHAGFHFARELEDLPAGEFRVGRLVEDEDRREFVMTGAILRLPAAARPAGQQ